ncbi:YcxB-like protein [Malonomonas rubra DSM 5091]|uniref:YcxB-like protein n=1 Tax=Malonomonas rubra DSM 5091 TaxID=1122189 RepID=A0A1M6JER4_MALRU|nr:YcxB family protein [Malonomonas rubra]SHJ45135.1 YcxB-like protein [Malonomonas rubra DSM 5091]
MPVTIIHSYQLTKDLWRQFYEAHYSCDRGLKMRYLWGAVCIFIGSLGFGGYYESKLVAGLLLATGFFGVLSKHLLIYKSLRAASEHPFFGKELTVSVSPEELSVRSENSGYSQPWDNFIGYRRLNPGFLLYHDRNSFFFIPTAELTAGDINRILRILTDSQVPEVQDFRRK